MKPWILAGIAIAAFGTASAAFAQDVIAQRRDGLRAMGRHMEAIKAVSDARGDTRPLVARVEEMITFYRGLPALFPAGSGTGDTRALPAIWSDRAGFERANANMVTQLEALRTAAASGDNAALTAAFNQTGATCGACHRPYRGPAR
ncbi:cytochrome c [Roseomonas alkaliterrae]|uniref:Cytochrome c556 n=1 Tax=Neoroseomonas alkaliterrae TaxID=1452450 RepID=A0A840Y945_9PROT|nr:cytochrome c [Neoroseomonas alkaliterrae]MBB5690553.1 cytochrome c556 [Neoroseomonas alkaliterrae]MBR0678177.1 cytochrome c [Neoroseomonas alkaliterrae]